MIKIINTKSKGKGKWLHEIHNTYDGSGRIEINKRSKRRQKIFMRDYAQAEAACFK